jgi:hypothetical protein
VSEPIRPISHAEPRPVEPVQRLRLLSPAEREEARRQREEIRKNRFRPPSSQARTSDDDTR